MRLSTVNVASILLIALASGIATAETTESEKTAKEVVSHYKLLRASCMDKQLKAKKVCFSRLKENHASYVAAKRTLALKNKTKNKKDVHYVSFL